MFVVPVAYYVPAGGIQQSMPRVEVVGNQATMTHHHQNQGYYSDQQQPGQHYQQPGYYENVNPGYGQYPQQTWGSYPGYSASYPQPYYQAQQPVMYNQGQYPPQHSYQQPQQPSNALVPAGQGYPYDSNKRRSSSDPRQSRQRSRPQVEPIRPQQPQPIQPPPPQQRPSQPTPQQQVWPSVDNRPPSQPGSRPNSRGGTLDRQRSPSRERPRSSSLDRQKQRPINVEIPGPGVIQGPMSTNSLPHSPRRATQNPTGSPPPRQLFELPPHTKREMSPHRREPVQHVHPSELVPPEVIQMYSGRKQREPVQQAPEEKPDLPQNGSFSRSSSLRRSDDQRKRQQQQQPRPDRMNVDLGKTHMNMRNSKEHLDPPIYRRPSQKGNQQQRPSTTANPVYYREPQASYNQPEAAQLVRHIPPDEANRLPRELFEEKPKWEPLRPEKFSIFGKEAAYPPFPVIGPRFMISVAGGAKLLEIFLSMAVLILVTIICDRGRCFPRTYRPMATEVVMWIVAGCAIFFTVILCIPYARKKPLSPKAYHRFLLIEVFLDILGAISYFVASICLLVIKEDDFIGYLIETWVVASALGFVCGVLYVCSTVFAWLALQRARYYLHFLHYASEKHRENPSLASYRMSVQPNPPAGHQAGYHRPPSSRI